MDRVEKALELCIRLHAGQRRKHSGLPYAIHPVEVMKTLANLGVRDAVVLAVAILHDTVEDTVATFDDLEQHFDAEIRNLVDALSLLDEGREAKLRYMESFASKDPRALLVKLADRYCNVMDYMRGDDPGYAAKYAAKAAVLYDAVERRIDEIERAFDANVARRARALNAELIEIASRHRR